MFGKQFQSRIRFWQVPLQVFKERRDAPEKHPRVPVIAPGAEILLGHRQCGLFGEAAHGENGEISSLPIFYHSFNVTKAGIRARGWDSQHDHVSGFLCYSERSPDDLTITNGLRNVV